MSAMNWDDAFELAKLRMSEDGIAWNIAYNEFRQLTNTSVSASIKIGQHLKELAATQTYRGPK